MSVYRIRLEVVREHAQHQLIENATLVYIEVVGNLVPTPVCQVLGVMVDLKGLVSSKFTEATDLLETYSIESISTNKGHCIGQNGTRDSVGRSNTDTWHHGILGFLGHNTGIELNVVRVLIEMTKLISDFRIGVDLLEGLVWLEIKELAELIQRPNLPFTGLLDTQNLDGSKRLRDVTGTKRTYDL